MYDPPPPPSEQRVQHRELLHRLAHSILDRDGGGCVGGVNGRSAVRVCRGGRVLYFFERTSWYGSAVLCNSVVSLGTVEVM